MNKPRINPKYLKGIVTYKYVTGSKLTERLYGLQRHYHGPFDCDIEDFKKFFAEVTHDNPLGSGEVTEIHLIAKKGVYGWEQGKGWTYYGR